MATCGVRKLLDFVFTQRELFWLDDILPGKNSVQKKRQMLKEEQELIEKKKHHDHDNHHRHHHDHKEIKQDTVSEDAPNYFTAAGSGSVNMTSAGTTSTVVKVKSEHQQKSSASSSPKSVR